jgi:hypothetical protein
MKQGILGVLLLIFTSNANAQNINQQADFLRGCWLTEDSNPFIGGECWRNTADGLDGIAFSTSDGDTTITEYLSIRLDEEGRLVYIAEPVGQERTRFILKEPAEPHRLIFENPEHDFPQVIQYTNTKLGMEIEISGSGQFVKYRMISDYTVHFPKEN